MPDILAAAQNPPVPLADSTSGQPATPIPQNPQPSIETPASPQPAPASPQLPGDTPPTAELAATSPVSPPPVTDNPSTNMPPVPNEPPPEPPKKPKSVHPGKVTLIASLFILVLTLPVAVYFLSQQNKQITENRSRAAGPCRRSINDRSESYCDNGVQKSHECIGGPCSDNPNDVCGEWGNESSGGSCGSPTSPPSNNNPTSPPAPTQPPGSSCGAEGARCINNWAYWCYADSRGLQKGTHPCTCANTNQACWNQGPSGTTPTSGSTQCPTGQIFCGGCIAGCKPATKTCNQWIDSPISEGGCRDPNAGCAGDGVLPAAGQSCCTGFTQCTNGRCARSCTPTCLNAGSTVPGPCCAGLVRCGTANACTTAVGGLCPGGATPKPTSNFAPTSTGQPRIPSSTPRPAAGTCGGGNQSCCDPFSNSGKICTAGLYCNTATGKCQSSDPGNLCKGTGGSQGQLGTMCKVFTCGNRCNKEKECNLNEQLVPCASASLNGQCGQIDFQDTNNNYCGVMAQNCGGPCAGTATQPTNPPGGPTSPPAQPTTPPKTPTSPPVAQCNDIRVYNAQGTDITAALVSKTALVKPGDKLTIGIKGTNAVKARFRVNGAPTNYKETTTKNAKGEFTADFLLPTGTTRITIEAQVTQNGTTWM